MFLLRPFEKKRIIDNLNNEPNLTSWEISVLNTLLYGCCSGDLEIETWYDFLPQEIEIVRQYNHN